MEGALIPMGRIRLGRQPQQNAYRVTASAFDFCVVLFLVSHLEDLHSTTMNWL